MAQFTIYRSSDTSAPSLTGATGSLVALLDAVLVNGYGTKAAAGWAKSFSGTSKAVYRPAAGNQFYLRVQDDGPGAGSFREARILGYEAMTTVDAGTNPFPTVAQLTTGMSARKSTTADGTARSWIVFADDRTVYVLVLTGDTAGCYQGWAFGDFYSLGGSGDGYRTFIQGGTAENNANVSTLANLINQISLASSGLYVPRGYSGIVGAIAMGKHGDAPKGYTTNQMQGLIGNATNPTDGGFYVSPLWIHDPTTSPAPSIRGKMRGFWHGLHASTFVNDGDTFTGTGDLAGKTFLVVKSIYNNANTTGYGIFETSNTLLTN